MSGYTGDSVDSVTAGLKRSAFVAKPFTQSGLLDAVDTVIAPYREDSARRGRRAIVG